MSKPLLGLPQGPETLTYRTFQWIVQTDPRLAGHVKSWAFMEGNAGSMILSGLDLDFDSPPARPEYFPALRARLVGSQGSYDWGSTDSLEGPIRIGVRVFSPGTHQDDIADLWHAIRTALRPRYDPVRYKEVQTKLRSILHFGSVKDSGGLDPPTVENSERNYLTATGVIEFHIRFPF